MHSTQFIIVKIVSQRSPHGLFKPVLQGVKRQCDKMARKLETTVCIADPFLPENIKIWMLDKFLFIEATKIEGLKGVNYKKHYFKMCLRVAPKTDVKNLKAFYSKKMIRFGYEMEMTGEAELIIDKSRARELRRRSPETRILPPVHSQMTDFRLPD